MKFMFVVGGSYKSFYINQSDKIRKVDLIIFHQDIFYEYDYKRERNSGGVVSCELIALNEKLRCPILVYGVVNNNGVRHKCYILCVNKKVSLIDSSKDIYLYIKGKFILIGDKIYKKSNAFATISITDDRFDVEGIGKNYPKNYFLCDKKGVSCLKNGKFYRKFRKCCYFSLSFRKKML